MHLRTHEQLVTPEDGRRLVDFLVYDSQKRKVENKETFNALQVQLSARFAEVQKEKAELLRKKKQPTKELSPYTGAP